MNMLEPLTVIILIPNHTQLKVSWILLIGDHLIIILVRYTPCRYFMEFGATLLQYENNTGYMYCVSAIHIIPQLCPSGTEVRFKVDGGCVNKTSKEN